MPEFLRSYGCPEEIIKSITGKAMANVACLNAKSVQTRLKVFDEVLDLMIVMCPYDDFDPCLVFKDLRKLFASTIGAPRFGIGKA